MEWFYQFLETYHLITYGVAAIGAFVEGPITLLLFGALAKARYLSLSLMFFAGCIGSVAHDITFWWIGRKLRALGKTRYLWMRFDKLSSVIKKIEPSMGLYVFLSKFAWNFNRVTLVAAGYVGLSLKRLLTYSIPAIVVWALSLVSIGYVFADQTGIFQQHIVVAGLAMSGIIVSMVALQLGLRHVFKRYFSFGNGNGAEK